MRDGVKLHTTIYSPKDQTQPYPILIKRTPYSSQPYQPDRYSGRIGPNPYLVREGYIFVVQDVRGRWMSEGDYDNMRPTLTADEATSGTAIDESTDTYDTIEWLIEHVPNHNGKVGIYGISYPGFYAAAALPHAHPALVAASPQAPIADFFFDDFHHHGAYTLMYWVATSTFGYQHDGPTPQMWYRSVRPETRDAWEFYMRLGPLKNSSQFYGPDNFFWQQLVEHPNYDEFWQRRSILPHLDDIHTNVMTVGGWFDAEDLYGPLNIYKTIERNNPDAFNVLVMGPWSHGDWARSVSVNRVGNIEFGRGISTWYQREVETSYFRHFLKGEGEPPGFEALVFDTGKKSWSEFSAWPPAAAHKTRWFLAPDGTLTDESPSSVQPNQASQSYREFISDPANPVPYRKREDLTIRFTPRPYMTDDQRFAADHPGVLVFESDVLESDVTLAGEITAHLSVSTDQGDADWVVKLIDAYPDDTSRSDTPADGELAGYQQMVRSEIFRGRFREGYETPLPFEPNEITSVEFPLQDVYHTFKKGHRILIHVQSSWFPLFDRNPQQYVENIFLADEEDFVKARHRVYNSPEHPSFLEIPILRPSDPKP